MKVLVSFREATGWLWMITERVKVDNAKLEEIDIFSKMFHTRKGDQNFHARKSKKSLY